MHSIAAAATRLLEREHDALVLPDHAVEALAAMFERAYDEGQAFEAASALMATAMVWLSSEGTGPAARTLLAMVLALHPALMRLDEKKAAFLRGDAEAAARRFGAFAGGDGERAPRVLDSGARPDGTTRANPLARFALLGQTPKKKPPSGSGSTS